MLTEKHKLILAQKVLEILRSNELNSEEIRGLFEGSSPKDSETKINSAVEQITKLFIMEQLTILEVVSLFKVVKRGAFSGSDDRRHAVSKTNSTRRDRARNRAVLEVR